MSLGIVPLSILVAFVVSVFSQTVRGQIDIKRLLKEICDFPLWAVVLISVFVWSYETFRSTTLYRLWAAARTPRVRVQHVGVHDLPVYNSSDVHSSTVPATPGEERDMTNVTPVSPRRPWNL